MKNVNGEEINEELFLKKTTEQLNDIIEILDDTDLTYSQQEKLVRQIKEHGITMFHYGKFNEKTLTN